MRAIAPFHQAPYRWIDGLRQFLRIMPKTLLWIIVLLLSNPIVAQDTGQEPGSAVGKVKQIVESTNVHRQVPYNSGNRRDPFLNPLLIKKEVKLKEDEEESRGLPPPGIAGTYIAQAALLGTIIRD